MDSATHEKYMRQALAEARKAAEEGEMLATTMASAYLGGKYLNECSLYVTMEPCTMCAGALAWAQLGELIIGAPDPHRGYSRLTPSVLHPRTKLTTEVLAEECSKIVKDFFKVRRKV